MWFRGFLVRSCGLWAGIGAGIILLIVLLVIKVICAAIITLVFVVIYVVIHAVDILLVRWGWILVIKLVTPGFEHGLLMLYLTHSLVFTNYFITYAIILSVLVIL